MPIRAVRADMGFGTHDLRGAMFGLALIEVFTGSPWMVMAALVIARRDYCDRFVQPV